MIGSLLLAVASQVAFVGCDARVVSGSPVPNATVIVQRDTIVRVGEGLEPPDGYDVIRCEGRPLTPGLIESDTSIGLVEVGMDRSSNDAVTNDPRPIRASYDAARAIDLRSSLVEVARSHGVTSVVSFPVGGLVEGRAAWVDLVAPRSRWASEAIGGPVAMAANLGQFGGVAAGGGRIAAQTLVREFLDDASYYRRNKSAYLRRSMYRSPATRLDLEAAQPVLQRSIPLVVEVHRAADIVTTLDLARELRIDLVLVGVSEGWLVADAIAERKVPVIVEPLQNLPFQFEARNIRPDNPALLARAGVKIALSTRSSHNAGNLRFGLGNAVRAGLPPELALAAATAVPAEIFGKRRLGTIARGQRADLVMWSGDPFEPASVAEVVLIRGERQPLDSRQQRLAERYIRRLGLRDSDKP